MTEFTFTRNKIAEMLDKDPRTIKKKIDAAKLSPVSGSGGFSKYRLSDVAAIVFTSEAPESSYEVETLRPKELKEHYQAGRERLKLETEEGELLKYDEGADRYAQLAKSFSQFFDTFIDDLEQTQLFTTEQLNAAENFCDDARTVFANTEF